MVEAQHLIATRHLTSDNERQNLLERLIDTAKPPHPSAEGFEHLDYLLHTPFRYRPPLRSGSRFGTRQERAIWYGADRVETALAEKSYHAIRFMSATEAGIPSPQIDWAAFRIMVRTDRGIDLSEPPFQAWQAAISSPVSYRAAQALGRAMRDAEVEAFRFVSARDPHEGAALGVSTPGAFVRKSVDRTAVTTWRGRMSDEGAFLYRRGLFGDEPPLVFRRADFEVNGRLPDPEA